MTHLKSEMTQRVFNNLRAAVASNSMLITRFCIVGAATALIYFVLYYVILMVHPVAPWIASGASFLIAIIFQYVGHSKFTFDRSLRDAAQLTRFVIAVTLGLAISTIVTGFIWPLFGWPEILSLIVVVIVLPIVNFAVFSFWVFVKPKKRDRIE